MGTTNLPEQIAFLEQRIANYAKSLLGNPPDRHSIETEKQVAEKKLAELVDQLKEHDRASSMAE